MKKVVPSERFRRELDERWATLMGPIRSSGSADWGARLILHGYSVLMDVAPSPSVP